MVRPAHVHGAKLLAEQTCPTVHVQTLRAKGVRGMADRRNAVASQYWPTHAVGTPNTCSLLLPHMRIKQQFNVLLT
jgi:hypothetical protein